MEKGGRWFQKNYQIDLNTPWRIVSIVSYIEELIDQDLNLKKDNKRMWLKNI